METIYVRAYTRKALVKNMRIQNCLDQSHTTSKRLLHFIQNRLKYFPLPNISKEQTVFISGTKERGNNLIPFFIFFSSTRNFFTSNRWFCSHNKTISSSLLRNVDILRRITTFRIYRDTSTKDFYIQPNCNTIVVHI